MTADPSRETEGLRVLADPAFENKELNPYNWLLYTHMEAMGASVTEYSPWEVMLNRYDVLHVHWPEGPLNQASFLYPRRATLTLLLTVDLARAKGTKVVWTVHNLESHDREHPRFESWFWERFTSRLDGFVALTESAVEKAVREHPTLRDLPRAVIPHGHYRDVYPDTVDQAEARRRLGLPVDARILGFFGMIRPYKNVLRLIRCFKALDRDDVHLLVSGRPVNGSLADEIRAEADGAERVHLSLEHVPEDRLQLHLRSMDLLCLPFTEILNSGSAILGLSFDRPVIVPDKGALRELRDQVGEDWVRLYEGQLDPSVLAEGLDWGARVEQGSRAPLDALDWTRIADQTLTFYERVVGEDAHTG